MRKVLLLAAVATLTTMSHYTHAQFCPGASPWVFDDVPIGDQFCGYITWAAQNGVTLGCAIIDANHRLYCPGDPVRREQMAAFVNRLGNIRVEAVGTGPGLTGGPITGVGTINLATTQLLPTTACTNNQIARWNGSAWVCSADANSGGTVTSVVSGTGLSGGPITSSGTLSVATGFQLPQGCTNGQVAKSNGSNAWTCASDANSGGTVTGITAGNGLTGGTITASGTIAVDPTSTTLTGSFFRQGGNAFGATAVLGTTDNNAIDVRANGARVIRYEPNASSPNVIGGSPANNVNAGASGAAIGGGGIGVGGPNRVTDNHGMVGGGFNNVAGNDDADMSNAGYAAVVGGRSNVASGLGSTVGGGELNSAVGDYSMVPGGFANQAGGRISFAGGVAAKVRTAAQVGGGSVNGDQGTFLWADSTPLDFYSAGANEFAMRATGGVRFVTAVDGSGNPTRTVKINGNGEFDFGGQNGQLLNFWIPPFGASYGIGLQTGTMYFRSSSGGCQSGGKGFSWFNQGVHSDNANDPGLGGIEHMRLACNGTLYVTNGTVGTLSDRASKQDFAAIDANEVLENVAQLPLSAWSYKANPGVRHIGPTSQDFHAAFGIGDVDARSIATVDADGVALAAIQGLNAKVEAQAREIAELRRALEVLMARVSAEGRIASR